MPELVVLVPRCEFFTGVLAHLRCFPEKGRPERLAETCPLDGASVGVAATEILKPVGLKTCG